MPSTYYVVRISTSASELPQSVTAFLEKQSCFHRLSPTDFIFAASTAEKANIRETLSSLLGSAGTVEVNAISFHSRP